MPRTRTIKKGNGKGNRNVSRGNKYTLNRLKERNRKQTRTRLRRGPNRNNYNNLPKHTRKQRAGMRNAARAGLGKAARYVDEKTTVSQSLMPGDGNLVKSIPFVRGLADLPGAAVGSLEFTIRASNDVKILIKEKLKSFGKMVDRSCIGDHDFQFDLSSKSDAKTICGTSYFEHRNGMEGTEDDFTKLLANIKSGYKASSGGMIVSVQESNFKKVGPNTVRFNATGKTKDENETISHFIVMLSPVNTDKTSREKQKMTFKAGTDKREIDNIRNFFFYNVFAPVAFTRPREEDKDKYRKRIKEQLEKITGNTIEGGMIEFFVNYIKNNTYLTLETKPPPPQKGGFPTLGSAAKAVGKTLKKHVVERTRNLATVVTTTFGTMPPRIVFKNRLDPNNFEMIYKNKEKKIDSPIHRLLPEEIPELNKFLYWTYSKKHDINKKKNAGVEEQKIDRKREKLLMNLINELAKEMEKGERGNIDGYLKEIFFQKILKEASIDTKTKEIPIQPRSRNRLCSNFGPGKDHAKDFQVTLNESYNDEMEYKKHLPLPIISGIDVYKPKLISKQGGINITKDSVQKRFFAIFPAPKSESNQEITDKDRADVYKAFSRIGVYINANNKNNFIRIGEQVKILSFADAEINKENFMNHLINLTKNLEPKDRPTETEAANLLKSVEGLNTNVAEKAEKAPERPPPPPPPPPPPVGEEKEAAAKALDTAPDQAADPAEAEASDPAAEASSAAEEARAQIPKNTVSIGKEKAESAIEGAKP
jgi:hypothetical protein